MKNTSAGHLLALLTALVWGTTFISTKLLLAGFQPVEILFFRFVISLAALTVICPHRLKGTTPRQEAAFAAAGLTGICLYYLLENIALTYTLASNVGVIVSVSPCFTALLTRLCMKDEARLQPGFFAGFFLAMAGICLISFNGAALELNPLGDLLAASAALLWACYTLLTRHISTYGFHTILVTRRTFAYGVLFMLPAMLVSGFRLELSRFADPLYLGNMIFLGLGASALCFVSWNLAVKFLGPVKTSVYLYLVPVLTVITSVLVLHERVTPMSAAGTLLTLAGLVISQKAGHEKEASAPGPAEPKMRHGA